MPELVGEFAAIGTALCFAMTSTLFTLSGREVGSPIINRTRLLLALGVMLVIHTLSFGQVLPLDANISRWFWLGISGVVGLALGDAFLFQAFVMIGPRLSMLIMALAPVLGAVLAFLFLNETLTERELAGMGLTIVGIMWVVSERGNVSDDGEENLPKDKPKRKRFPLPKWLTPYMLGLLFAFGGASGQAGGLVLSKFGLEGEFSAFSANLMRIVFATATMWIWTATQGRVMEGFVKLRANPRAFKLMSIGTITGPVLGVWLSLIAVQRAPVGIASTLMSLTPIFLLPVGYFVFGESISKRAVLGTILAFAGTGLLFL